MRANDDPSTRIKAAHAKSLWAPSAAVDTALNLRIGVEGLAIDCNFFGLGVIHLYGGVFTVEAAADSDRGVDILIDYLTHAVRGSEGVVRQRSGIVLLGVHNDGRAEVATYGVSMTDCHTLGLWGKQLLDNITPVPFQTWFGWGRPGGEPTPLTADELATLSPTAQAWVAERTR
jgi:hypothetical protein